MRKLTIIVPSRGRPESIRQLNLSFNTTCTLDTELVVAVDDDDATLPQYRQVWEEEEHGFKLVIGPRLRIGPTLNKIVPIEAASAFAVGFMGDDHRPRTEGWDAAYVTALEDMGTGVVYGDDLIMGPQIPTQVAMTSDIVLATGRFVPDGMIHLWLDNAWKSLGEGLGGLRYLPQVIVEHLHPIAGKAQWDEHYRENNTDEVFEADRVRYEDWKVNELPTWIQQIREYSAR